MTEIQDTEIESVLYELVEPIATAAGVPQGRLKIHIINNDEFNAFVGGGEDVYINTGLIAQVKNPNAVQAVVAHELGHMVGGHMAQMSARMDAEMKRSLAVQALGIALMFINPMAGAGLMAGASGMANQGLMAFTRDEERVADNMGIDLLVKSRVSTDGFTEVMRQMNDMVGAAESRVNPFNISHPLTTERIQNAKEKIKETKGAKSGGATAEQKKKYALVRAKIIGYLSSAAHVSDVYPSSDKSDGAVYARAIAAMRAGNLAAAKTGTLVLVTRSPKNPFFYELLGDIEYQYGHYDDSIVAYEKSLELINEPTPRDFVATPAARAGVGKTAPQIQVALALVLSERAKPAGGARPPNAPNGGLGESALPQSDTDRAIELAKRANLGAPSPLAYWVLARAYQAKADGDAKDKTGLSGISDWAMAEFYAAQHDAKNAKKYAASAQKKLQKSAPEYIKSGDILKSDAEEDD